ncbi:glycosyltransferase [Micromonospora sp. NPDC050417]|uniref:glycosyltransferase n=1 Tax=Micromonospora sp. NPDC050417 TaxID=3364280 RepID=UPI00378A2673
MSEGYRPPRARPGDSSAPDRSAPDLADPDWVVMLSGSPWRADAHRQQAMARQLAADRRVLFVDPPGQRPRWRWAVRPVAPRLWHAVVPTALPMGRQLPPVNVLTRRCGARVLRRWLDERPGPRLLWIDEDLAAPAIGRLGESAVVYDATDLDWTFTRWWNRWHLRAGLRAAVSAADLVLASSSALPERLPAARRPAVVVPNGCDPDQFTPVGPVAPWVARLPRPLLGYAGAVDTRAFDAELVASVAAARPEWTFLLVGPSTPAGRAPLERLANVLLVDAVPFAETPAILRACDVTMIPYRVNGLIDYVHPKKCYEYLALGKPVVATPLPALRELRELRGAVRLAGDAAEFTAAVEQALRTADQPAEVAERRAMAVRNAWSVRGALVRELLAGIGASP